MARIINHPKLTHLAGVLEVPGMDGKSGPDEANMQPLARLAKVKLLLTSADARNPTLIAALQDLLGAPMADCRIAVITTAATIDADDKSWFIRSLNRIKDLGIGLRRHSRPQRYAAHQSGSPGSRRQMPSFNWRQPVPPAPRLSLARTRGPLPELLESRGLHRQQRRQRCLWTITSF